MSALIGDAVIGLLLLIVLWPGPAQGRRVVQRWGVADPDPDEVSAGVTYLRRRRLWYPWLFVGTGVAAAVLPRGVWDGSWWSTLLTTLLAGALLAELVGMRRGRHGRRTTVRELAGTVGPAMLVTVVVAVVVSALVADPGPVPTSPDPATRIVLAVGVAALAGLIALLAARRPVGGSARVDLALRRRSARVSVGLGAAAAGSLGSGGWAAATIALVGDLTWIAVAQRPATPAARSV